MAMKQNRKMKVSERQLSGRIMRIPRVIKRKRERRGLGGSEWQHTSGKAVRQ